MKTLSKTLLLTLLLTACAMPVTNRPDISDAAVRREIRISKELAMKNFVRDMRRLHRVSYSVLKNNASQCQKGKYEGIKPSLGFDTWNDFIVDKEWQDAIHTAGVKRTLSVQAVAKNSPAAKAGIKDGDQIISVDGIEMTKRIASPQEFDDAVELSEGKSVELVIKRDGKEITKNLFKENICEYPIELDYEDTKVNAYTDGKKIVFSKGLLKFTESDTELALVAAHELAHITMGHIDKKRQNALIGSLGGLLLDVAAAAAGVNTGGEISKTGAYMGASSYSVEFEQEADYVGMYYLARAGYSTANVETFWRRMAIDSPKSMTIKVTHPTSPERFIAIKRTHDEIQDKKKAKKKLLPNMKKDS